MINGELALDACKGLAFKTVLDVGSGDGMHAAHFCLWNKELTTVDYNVKADFVGDYMDFNFPEHDLIWCCHVLEHQPNVQAFLKKLFWDLKPDGYLAITVPPAKKEIVGGHVTIWNAGLLLYNLILAGFDCSKARIRQYDYNISVIVQKKGFIMPHLKHDFGDIEALSNYFPFPVKNGFDGEVKEWNWL